MGITEEELAETIQLAASVGSGSLTAMAIRASAKSSPQMEGKVLKDYLYFSR
ncbi:hypothetical protein [Desulfofundulus thermobenzoicus]|uniref:hypothetical protein n=1 Tax=Desulfofundulus thermobenzoicus TaxID=29376 RepID=UPI00128FA5A4|nr:hypothetical protein [Desulfofundulus thermobenzoicus]